MDPSLAASYSFCRALHRAHGRTYFLATRLLPRWKRRHVHALYGFTRYTDDIVDNTGDRDVTQRAERLRRWTERFAAALHGERVDDPVLPAVLHTIKAFELDPADFTLFLRSMAMDLTITEYETYDDLRKYMAGSAAAIGTMMLPILGSDDLERAREPARELGLAFQLTNFIRDVREDLDRGRIYLPMKDLARFGVTRRDLRDHAGAYDDAHTREGVGAHVRDLIAYEVRRARGHYLRAAPGIAMLAPTSQTCIRTAYRLYGGILDEVVRADFDVFRRRATVPNLRRIAVTAACLLTPSGRPPKAPASGRWPSQDSS